MEVDDRKNLYEVRDPQDEYDGSKDEFPHRPITNIKINDQINRPKWPIFLFVGIQAVVILILIILLGINGVTLTHLNTLPVCDNSNNANTGGLTSGNTGGVTCNCTMPSVVNCSGNTAGSISCDALTSNIGQIANMSKMLLANQDDDNTQGVAQASLLNQLNQRLVSNLTQLVNTAQRTESKVDGIQSSVDYQMTITVNVTDVLSQIWDSVDGTAQRLTNIVSTLSNIKDTGTSSAGVIDDVLLAVNELLELQNASALFNSIQPVSCADIKRVLPNSPSGYYHVNSRNIYCNMGELCGVTGAWTRIGYLDMTDGTQTCPSGFQYYQQGNVRACGRQGNAPSCSPSLSMATNGINYTQICGRVTGYQIGSPDAIAAGANHNNINSYYTDGVSVTRGSPRQHIWTYMAGYTQRQGAGGYICPCSTGSTQTVQSFVGSNYYCESGNPNWWTQNGNLYTGDPLWDGQGCGNAEGSCCTSTYLPWFFRDFGNVSSSLDLEMRICGDEGVNNNENTPVSYYEFYVK